MRLQIYVNGILNLPGASLNWTGRAVTWTHSRQICMAEKVEYFCGPIGRAFGQRDRSEKFARTLSFYGSEWQKFVCAHSNGADVVLRGLASHQWPRIECLHLVSAACEAHFDRNGLNEALLTNRIGHVVIYVAAQDRALRLAKLWPGRWLGYGTLGLHGPLKVNPMVKNQVTTFRMPSFGHSTWFDDLVFEETMQHLTAS